LNEKDLQELVALRRGIHSHPELSGRERHTAERIRAFLHSCHPSEIFSGLGGHGLLAIWDSGVDGPYLMLRCELDALPIRERGDKPHGSQYPGVAHLCGHDGHMTILCGVARALSEDSPSRGRVGLLFQPAEETGAGALAVLEDPRFPLPDMVFALHNIPGVTLHQVLVGAGAFTAAVNSMVVRLEGVPAHAAEPEQGCNPAVAVAEMLLFAAHASRLDPGQQDFRLATPVYGKLGEEGFGTSAGSAVLHFTLRAWEDAGLRQVEEELEAAFHRIAQAHDLPCTMTYREGFPATRNAEALVALAERAAERTGLVAVHRVQPFRWGEDFGHFSTRTPACLLGLGAGEDCRPLHHPEYDFPDALLRSGVQLFREIIHLALKKS
jgi:amidohydrolase